MPIHFQYMKVSATMAEDSTRHSLLPAVRANWVPLHGTDRSQGFGLFPLVLDQESCRCSAPLTAGLCSCLWRCLLRFEGRPPPAGPSVRPILDAVIKHPLPQKSSWGLCAHSYTPSPAGSRLQLWHLLHEPSNTWHLPRSKFWIKWILQNLCSLSNRSPLSRKENPGGEKGSM